MTAQDPAPLTTERIATSRRGPLTVLVAALAVLALFIWKPWGGGPIDSDLPRPSQVAIAPITPSPSPLLPEASPDIIQYDPSQVLVVDAHSFAAPARAFVTCTYTPVGGGDKTLTALTVGPPTIAMAPASHGQGINRITWRVFVEVNHLESVFSSDWVTVKATRETGGTKYFDAVELDQIRTHYRDIAGPTIVARVKVVVYWYANSKTPVGEVTVVPKAYAIGKNGPIVSEGCFTVI